jgi:hypothetical protein
VNDKTEYTREARVNKFLKASPSQLVASLLDARNFPHRRKIFAFFPAKLPVLRESPY